MNTLPMRGLRRTVGLLINLALVAATLGAVVVLLPSLLGYERYVITGGSMTGTYDKGSLVFERTKPADELQVGDVITYLPPSDSGLNTLVTHRIVSIITGEDGRPVLQTQGDANPDLDPWKFSLVEDRQPVAEFSIPYVGYALIALADPSLRRLLIGVPAGIVGLIALAQLIGALRPIRPQRSAPICVSPVDLSGVAGGSPLTSVGHASAAATAEAHRPLVAAGTTH